MKKPEKIKIVVRRKYICPHCRQFLPDDFVSGMSSDTCVECPLCNRSFYFKEDTVGVDVKTKNERRDERCVVSLAVTYRSPRDFIKDYTENVSRGGMFVRTKNPYNKGDLVDLYLHIPGLETPIKLKCEVVHIRRTETPGVGVKFIGITKADRDRIVEYIRQHRCE